MQGRFFKAPPALMRPECLLELVLHVKQPYSDRSASSMIGRCTSTKAQRPMHQISRAATAAVAAFVAAMVLSHACQPLKKPTGSMSQDKQIGRPDAEHDGRVPVNPVAKTAPERERRIFLHRERIDVAEAAPFEVTGGSVMDGVSATPEVIRRVGKHADRAATQSFTRRWRKKEPWPQSC